MDNKTKCISLESISKSKGVLKTIAESTSTINLRNHTTPASNALRRWNKFTGLRQLAENAVKNGVWIEDFTPLTVDGLIINRGTENTVYLSIDRKNVIKLNHFSFLNEDDTRFEFIRDMDYFFNRIIAHYALFPENAYQLIGFSENRNGQISVILKQPFIYDVAFPTQQEIDTELQKRNFRKMTLGKGVNHGFIGYTDGTFELTDAKPQNVLIDKNGAWYFIDLDISKTIF